jgi:hypothetical protein
MGWEFVREMISGRDTSTQPVIAMQGRYRPAHPVNCSVRRNLDPWQVYSSFGSS